VVHMVYEKVGIKEKKSYRCVRDEKPIFNMYACISKYHTYQIRVN
jgi:hypothetical protein